MKTAGIVTLYGNINYGNKLQNYAVSELLKSNNLDVTTLTYQVREVSKKRKLLKFFGIYKENPKDALRKKNFEEFSEKWISKRYEVNYYKDISDLNEKFDLFIAGSDQIWHAWEEDVNELDYFMLRFADRNKRMALSPSFGFDEFPKARIEQFKKGLLGFNHLSCRENKGCQLIEELTGQKAVCLLDPTMLIATECWDLVLKKPEYELPDKFILCYFLRGMSEGVQQKIKEFANNNNFEIVDVLDKKTNYYTSSPDEFLYLIKESQYICTDSFHGCVFSILFHKNFSVYASCENTGKQMQSRIDTLLSKFNLEECKDSYAFDKNVNYSNVEYVLKQERKMADEYINMCLNNILK